MSKQVFRLLALEPHPEDAATIATVLERTGILQVTPVATAAEGRERWGREAFDAVLVDYSRGEAKGRELLKTLRETKGELPVVFILTEERRSFREDWPSEAVILDRAQLPLTVLPQLILPALAEVQQRRQEVEAQVTLPPSAVWAAQQQLIWALRRTLELTQRLSYERSTDWSFAELDEVIGKLFGCSAWGVLLVTDAGPQLEVFLREPLAPAAISRLERTLVETGKQLLEMPFVAQDLTLRLHGQTSLEGPTETRELCLPLVVRGETMGLAFLCWAQVDFAVPELQMFSLLASQLALALDNSLLLEASKRAIVDDLTGFYNRRHFFQALEKEIARVFRYGHLLSMVLLDIDHFKAINDTYGHQVGDEVLQEVADVLRHNTRQADFWARYGGEEFVCLAPGIDLAGARSLGEKLRRLIAEHSFTTRAGELCLTVSVGVAQFNPQRDRDADSFFARADHALYQAKQRGRNILAMAP